MRSPCLLVRIAAALAAMVAGVIVLMPAAAPASDFVVEPYVQLGGDPSPTRMVVLWHADDQDAAWSVTYQSEGQTDWRTAEISHRLVAVPTIAPHRVYRASLTELSPGAAVRYRVRLGERPVFEAATRAVAPPGRATRVAVLGDCGAGTPAQRAIAHGIHSAQPDCVVVTGDIVYSRGRISEYRPKFYPVYNAAAAGPDIGAPLLRSTLFVAAPGNHDIASRNLGEHPDGLAYFLYWDQPRNGFDNRPGPGGIGPLQGPEDHRARFLQAAGDAYPRMANFSFDHGDVHWMILDANGYVDWSAPGPREWIARDLAAARDKPWRFVAFHQPGFNGSKAHFNDQRTRELAPLFEAGDVAIVFAGHVHNYQRSHPLRFQPEGGPDREGRVAGKFSIDTTFDGREHTRPEGVIYLVTGAGGQKLYNPEQQDDPASWPPFTTRFISKVHTFTVVDTTADRLSVRQLDADGTVLDRFDVTR